VFLFLAYIAIQIKITLKRHCKACDDDDTRSTAISRTAPVSWYQNVSILDFIGARMTEVVETTGAIRRTKLQWNHHHQQTNTSFLQAGCPSCRPTNSVVRI